ncbi:E3 ubiquitin-protein ligase rnf43 [Kalmusia sp. IMI 367209]|nr:E3 ubiquitin-protein ligase rnf43 [Kalmusia sp. IMI 367209]
MSSAPGQPRSDPSETPPIGSDNEDVVEASITNVLPPPVAAVEDQSSDVQDSNESSLSPPPSIGSSRDQQTNFDDSMHDHDINPGEELLPPFIADYDESEPSDPVPHRAVGPRIDPRTIATVYTDVAEQDMCMICQYLFNETVSADNPCMQLSCDHLFHLECIDELINFAYEGQTHVRCPCCRQNVCAARPTQSMFAPPTIPPTIRLDGTNVEAFRDLVNEMHLLLLSLGFFPTE